MKKGTQLVKSVSRFEFLFPSLFFGSSLFCVFLFLKAKKSIIWALLSVVCALFEVGLCCFLS